MNTHETARNSIPTASIIILSYNGKRYLEPCLTSVLDQTLEEDIYEVIVADNASKDGSAELVEDKFKAVKVLRFKRNTGFTGGNNKALPHCSGDFIILLNQDTVVHREWLEQLLTAASNNEQYGALQSNILMPRNKGFASMEREKLLHRVYYYDLTKFGYVEQLYSDVSDEILETRFVSGASLLLRREILVKIGYLFDSSLGNYAEDLDLSLRLVKAGYKLGTVSNSIVYHKSESSFRIDRYSMWKNYVMIRNRILAFWKHCSVPRFLLLLPLLIASQPIKIFRRARQLEKGRTISLLIALAAVPSVIVGLIGAIIHRLVVHRHMRDDVT